MARVGMGPDDARADAGPFFFREVALWTRNMIKT
jgi:hypothetical protein